MLSAKPPASDISYAQGQGWIPVAPRTSATPALAPARSSWIWHSSAIDISPAQRNKETPRQILTATHGAVTSSTTISQLLSSGIAQPNEGYPLAVITATAPRSMVSAYNRTFRGRTWSVIVIIGVSVNDTRCAVSNVELHLVNI